MVEETETQPAKAKGGRKGKATQMRVIDNEATNKTETNDANEETDSDSDLDNGGKQYNFHMLAKLLEPVPKLMSHNYYSWSVSEVACLKPEISSCINTITDSVKLCNSTCGFAILHKICSRAISITFLARICSCDDAIADFN